MNAVQMLKQSTVIGDRVFLQQVDAETKTTGGIVIPEVAAKKPLQGIVLKSNVKEIPEGRQVLYSPFAGVPVVVGGQVFMAFDPQDIILVLPEDK